MKTSCPTCQGDESQKTYVLLFPMGLTSKQLNLALGCLVASKHDFIAICCSANQRHSHRRISLQRGRSPNFFIQSRPRFEAPIDAIQPIPKHAIVVVVPIDFHVVNHMCKVLSTVLASSQLLIKLINLSSARLAKTKVISEKCLEVFLEIHLDKRQLGAVHLGSLQLPNWGT